MSLLLRSPGDIAESKLPGFKSVTVYWRVPDQAMAKSLLRAIERFEKEPETVFEEARKHFGKLFVKIEGLGTGGTDTEEIAVEEKSGHLTREQGDRLVPLVQKLWAVVGNEMLNVSENSLGN